MREEIQLDSGEDFPETQATIQNSYTEHSASVSISGNYIGSASLFTSVEASESLLPSNNSDRALAPFKSIVALFREWVKKAPHNLAIAFKEKKLTYQVLDDESDKIARFLRSKGVKREIFVPVCISPGIEMVLWILGILKAGGAYIPIDPESPVHRVDILIGDIKPSLVVVDRLSKSKFLPKDNIKYIEVEQDLYSVDSSEIGDEEIEIRSEDLAYVIFTSGSTGKPKGVMIEHGSLMNYLHNSKANYIDGRTKDTGSFMHLSYTFDASLTALFMPLIAGKLLVIGSKQHLETFEDDNFVKYAPYDFIKLTPAHLELFKSHIRIPGNKLATKKLVVGGEALHPAHFEDFSKEGLDIEIVNEYGPTEATVGCTTYSFFTITDSEKIRSGISIGRPLDNVQIYIMDENMKLLPAGVAGEIYIGGACLARGYLHDPVLTEAKFIVYQPGITTSERLYKTGDTAKWLPDGNIEYIGRKDDQVKINGYRIELGEVESAINNLPFISSNAVVVKKGAYDVKKLACYYIPTNEVIKEKEKELTNAEIEKLSGLINSAECPAPDPNGKADSESHTIIIDLAQQRFQGKDYMSEVIRNSIAKIKDKGKIIITNVHDIRLLEAFKLGFLIKNFPAEATLKEFKWSVELSVLEEEELWLAPEYFYQFQELHEEISHIDIHSNERSLTDERDKFRYTATVYVRQEPPVFTNPEWLSWAETKNGEDIVEHLVQGQHLVAVRDVPNAALSKEQLISCGVCNKHHHTIDDLLAFLQNEDKGSNKINEIFSIARDNGYQHKLFLNEDKFKLDVVFIKGSFDDIIIQPFYNTGEKKSLLANTPLLSSINKILQGEIQALLKQTLPDYMVPLEFHHLTRLPLTVNGKIDRAFLSTTKDKIAINKSTYQPPKNPVEAALVNIWQNLLAIEQVSTSDNFFELGGSSLQAARLFSIMGKYFMKNLPLGLLVKAPTIEKLATALSNEVEGENVSSLVPIQPFGSKTPLFCIHGGWGNVLFYRHLASHLGSAQPVFGLQVKGLNGKEKPFYKMEDMASYYLSEILSVQPEGPYYLAGYCYGAIVAFEIAQQLIRQGKEVALLANFNGLSPNFESRENFTKTETGNGITGNSQTSASRKNRFANASALMNEWAQPGIKDRLLFAAKKMKASMVEYAHLVVQKIGCAFFIASRKRMPDKLLSKYIQHAMHKAQKKYRPSPYPGEMIVFRSPKLFEDPQLGWSELVKGEIKTFDIPGEHPTRTHIMYEPFVQSVAQELKKYLS